jgi:hypothetical protein
MTTVGFTAGAGDDDCVADAAPADSKVSVAADRQAAAMILHLGRWLANGDT